jgi:hypothetical protein
MNLSLKKALFAFAVASASSLSGGNEINPDAIELSPLPKPEKMQIDSDLPVSLDEVSLYDS